MVARLILMPEIKQLHMESARAAARSLPDAAAMLASSLIQGRIDEHARPPGTGRDAESPIHGLTSSRSTGVGGCE